MPLTRPTTTPLPDEIYDEWVPLLSEAELKVLLYIVRRTLGFHKGSDAISLTQFARGIVTRDGRVLDKGCGITSRATLIHALSSLEHKGLITARKGTTKVGGPMVTVYALSWEHDGTEGDPEGGGSHCELGGADNEPGWFASRTRVVRNTNRGSAQFEPTTNSMTTNSVSTNSETGGAPPRAESAAVTAGEQLWRAVVEDLRDVMTAENVTHWLLPARVLAAEAEKTLRIGVPSALHRHWLDRRLRRQIDAALERCGGDGWSVQVEVVP